MNVLYNPIFFAKVAKAYLTDIDRVWKKNEEEIKKYQDKALKKIVKYAYTTPLYHEKYKKAGIKPNDIKGIKDIEKIPFITKEELRRQKPENLIPKGINEKKLLKVSTSGSTGRSVSIYSDAYTVFKTFMGFIRTIKEHNMNWRKNRLTIISDQSPESAEEAYFSRVALPNVKSFFSMDNIQSLHVGEKPLKMIKKIDKFNPDFIGGYPGILKILALLKRQGNGKNIQPRVISSSGAILDQYTREYIEKSFNSKIFDMYGATECSPIAFQCKKGNYHVMSDFSYMELIDYDKKKISPGDMGNLVITKLFGKGTPVIRYTGLSDMITSTDRKCDCGINTALIEKIEGRKVDCIILPDGKIIPPSSFTGIPYKVMHKLKTDKIQQFQIIQQSKKEIDVLIVIDDKTRNVGPKVDKIFNELKKQFVKNTGKDVIFNITEVNKIEKVRDGSVTPPPVVISKVKE